MAVFTGLPLCVFVTGGDGFVGRHLVRRFMEVRRSEDRIVVGTMQTKAIQVEGVEAIRCDITEEREVIEVLSRFRPTHVVHLAAISSLQAAQSDVRKAWQVNLVGTLNVALGITSVVPNCRMLHCSSGLIYGDSFRTAMPATEDTVLAPTDVYSASKAAADLMVGQMCRHGLRGIRLRPFNHIGVGQSENFVIPAFASQIARAERSGGDRVLNVGNLDNRRDITDVSDVVEAYLLAIESFDRLPSGSAINIASGVDVSVGEMLKILLSFSTASIRINKEESRVRKLDLPTVLGCAETAQRLLGWKPRRNIKDSLEEILNYYRSVY